MKRLVEGPPLEQLLEASLGFLRLRACTSPSHASNSSSASSWRKLSTFPGPCDWPEPTCRIPSTPFPEVCSLVTSAESLCALSHGTDAGCGYQGTIAFERLWCPTRQCQIAVGAPLPPPLPSTVCLCAPARLFPCVRSARRLSVTLSCPDEFRSSSSFDHWCLITF